MRRLKAVQKGVSIKRNSGTPLEVCPNQILKWPITTMKSSSSLVPWVVFGLLIVVGDLWMLFVVKFWDFSHWIAVCK
jgi:hypothetical protein